MATAKSQTPHPARKNLIDRLFDSAQKQIDEITRRVEAGGRSGVQAEHDARATAALVKVLGGLVGGAEKIKTPRIKMTMTTDPATSTNSGESLRDKWMKLSPDERLGMLLRNNDGFCDFWRSDFDLFAHSHQRAPRHSQSGGEWATWLVLGGRGAGKTRLGAEWVRHLAMGRDPAFNASSGKIALVAETEHDAREVMVEGVSGILAVHARRERPTWTPTRRRLEWQTGAVAQIFSAEEPDSLRGPQFSVAWCDEIAKWKYAQATFDMLQFGLRLGQAPRQVITTTPRPIPLIKALLADPRTAITRAATYENAFHLAPAFLENVMARYAGTRLGRQELDGDVIDDRPDALWSRGSIDACRFTAAPPLARIVVAVDPPASARAGADACGIVAAGVTEHGEAYVLADESASGLSPAAWAQRAINLWRRLEADSIVAEVNMGGDMVSAVIRECDAHVPVIPVRATRGKRLRAEPVAALYEQGRVRHAGMFPALEDEMCDFGLDGLSAGRSPDRLDALVWALTALCLGPKGMPRVRGL